MEEQMAQFRDCSEGCQALTELTGAVNTVVATTDLRLKRVEDGVSNFRAFQVDARDFFAEHRATEVEREKQLNKRDQEIKDSLENYHALQQNRQWWIMFGMGVLSFFVAVAFGLLTVPPAIQAIKELFKSDIHLPHIVKQEQIPVRASNAQDAQNPRNP